MLRMHKVVFVKQPKGDKEFCFVAQHLTEAIIAGLGNSAFQEPSIHLCKTSCSRSPVVIVKLHKWRQSKNLYLTLLDRSHISLDVAMVDWDFY